MSDPDSRSLTIELEGSPRRARLTVAPPVSGQPKAVEFAVVPDHGGPAGQLVRIDAEVIFTTASNERDGWRDWHVKIYRCANGEEASALREHLHRQAAALQRVNSYLPAPQRRQAIEPPWAVVPVQVVRGDGQLEEMANVVTTRLGVPLDQIVARLRQHLPAWLGDRARPEEILFAVSPQIDPLRWEDTNPHPATEHLEPFLTLAAGLDHLHSHGWAHCDIKPDNVCRCTYAGRTDYVLIDTDAATRAEPPPQTLRTSQLYEYRGLRQLRLRPGHEPSAGLFYAQDRFGFLTVVLSALAGREWVDRVLLAPDPEDRYGGRIVDSGERVDQALAALWPDERWRPLRELLAEPFGTGPRGQIALEHPDPWAADWLNRVREAEARCVDPVRSAARRGTPAPWLVTDAEVERVRAAAQAHPAGRNQRVRLAYSAVARGAQAAAASQFRLAAWRWGAGLTGSAVLVALGAFVIGR
ncbi:protein kinase family protein [Actinoplanes regularis]|uniref:Protein kinase domain-containing protein n=1 Tax=Actinoplanes regularis TaxID=52697 RepID=A0A238ZVH1_9ACTN|nr:protein kinase family protein [Actinoplanes regularis]GIE90225.1 hypothetical protein Are01nite_67050 [Actinoplanes regularis]SNR87340.1 hypothetical protein SAMN06264365_106344 [Actinoplanes regularis]